MDLNKKFIQEFGEQQFKDLFEKASLIYFGKHSIHTINTATCYNFKSVDTKKCSAFGSFEHNNTNFEFEILFGRHPHTITYYHNNNVKKDQSFMPNVSTNNNSTKTCTCDWSKVKVSGCKCGAIKPYKPQY